MSNSQVDVGRHDPDHVTMDLPGDIYDALAARCAPGQSVSELVDTLFAPSLLESSLRRLRERQRSLLPGHWKQPVTRSCKCCKPVCRRPLHWRGSLRCGCPK